MQTIDDEIMNIDKIKNFLKKINLIRLAIFWGCLIPFIVLSVVAAKLSKGLDAQTFARRFDKSGGYAQISAFLTQEAAVDAHNIRMMEFYIDQGLQEGVEVSEETGRPYIYGYSAPVGKIDIRSDRASVNVDATAVGGDFFMFHPYELVSGAFFDGNDLNGDGVILDTNAAWTLFGGSSVAGMRVEIGGNVYPVRGVIRRDTGFYAKASGEEDSMVFISYGVADNLAGGMDNTDKTDITCFELMMRNPVKQYAYGIMDRVLNEKMGLEKDSYELVENSSRFSFLSGLKVVKSLGTRSMKKNTIIYPGWENRARGYEDVIGIMTLFKILLLIYPLIIVIIYAVRLVKLAIAKIKKVADDVRKKAADKYRKKWLERQETNVQDERF